MEWEPRKDPNRTKTDPMKRYIIAKANPTAYAFVVKEANFKPEWTEIDQTDSYTQACDLRDGYNAGQEGD